MTDQAELNRVIVSNLADLEAAAHHVEDVIEPMLESEVERVVVEFARKSEWKSEFNALYDFWVAPPEWADQDGEEGDYVCHFEVDAVPRTPSDQDYLWLSALTGAGLAKAGLYWNSEAISAPRLAKLIAANPEVIEKLQTAGFVYDVANRRSLYLPILIDREQLAAGLADDALDEAAEPFANALEAARAAVSLFEPLVDALRGAEE